MILKRAFLFAAALCAAPLLAAPNKMCIPVANGVPGTLAWQHPPNWWNPDEGKPLYNTALNAPGWRGATAVSHPAGGAGTDHVHFRALHRNVSGTEYLFLSWWGKVVPKAADFANELYVGFHDVAGVGQDVVLMISIASTADTGTRDEPAPSATQYAASIAVKPFGSSDTAWDTYTGPPSAVPAWINGVDGTGRLWLWAESLEPSLPAQWAFQLRVPITTSNDLNNGIRISSPFNFWYEFRAADPMAGDGYVSYFWPRTAGQMNDREPRPIAQWGEARLTSGTPENPDTDCPSDGVSLKSSDILTLNSDPHKIQLGPNILRAIPFNGMTTPVSLTATFRFADWGTGPTWETVTNPNPALWNQLGNAGGPVSIAAGAPGVIDTTYTAGPCDACQYRGYYLENKATCDSMCLEWNTNDTRATHQCMLVQLSGPGVDFINDSAYTNMNFADTSKYSEDAKVNLAGLPETSPGSLARDVYIFVQRSNMPPSTTPSGPGRPSSTDGHQRDSFDAVTPDNCIPSVISDPNVPRERRKAEILKGLSQRAFTYEDLQSTIPTVIYHAYYDTLQRTAAGSPILLPLNPFGYFPMHDGTPAGWKAILENAEELEPNWYRVRVGSSGVATVRPVIEAIERRGATGGYRFFLDVGPNFPQGSFGDGIDGQLSINAGLERFVAANTSIEAILGYHAFDSDFGSNPRIWQLSANVKQYFGEGRLHSFVNGGVGAYRFDPGSTTRAGANVGAGVLYDLSSVWGVEGVYNFHMINTSDSRARFSTVQIGVRRSL